MKTFTSRQVVTMVLAVCGAVVLAPVGAIAASSLITITDPTNGSKARVDAGRLRVGDGSGALTIDGSAGPAAPANPFTYTANVRAIGPTAVLAAQRRGSARLAITAISAYANSTGFQVVHYTSYVVGSTTFSCPSTPDSIAPAAREFDLTLAAIHATSSVAYPSPLVFFRKSTPGTTSCLYVSSTQVGTADFDVSTTLNGYWSG